MEQLFTERDMKKIINKKFPGNSHILVVDRSFKGNVLPCICDTSGNVLYYLKDRSSATHTDIFIYDSEDNEAARIRQITVKIISNDKKNLYPCRFIIDIYGEPKGDIRIDLLSLRVNLEDFENDWNIEYSDKHSLGYDYKYTVFKRSTETAHFRSKVIHQQPVYIMDHDCESDRLFLVILFIIHSVYTNKKQKKGIKKPDRLARNTGLLGL